MKNDSLKAKSINESDLVSMTPTVILLNGAYIETYPVIIYTHYPDLLKKKGILVQSVSASFVTALIQKKELKTLYNLKEVTHIALPTIDKINNLLEND